MNRFFAGLLLAITGLALTRADAQQFQLLNEFLPAPANPYAAVLRGSDGQFYGTTALGGANSKGAVFKIDSSGTMITLHSFAGSDGANPIGGLVQGNDGAFYGTTYLGGANGKGTVFKMDASSAFTTLHSFAESDGMNPFAALMQGSDGSFYGATYYGGANGKGTLFKITTSGAVTTLHSFAGSDGANPIAELIQSSDGNLYGITYGGGSADKGTVFRMNAAGVVTTLHSFAGSDGANPHARLIQASDGNFYGTSRYGGVADKGTIFRMNAAGVVTTLHSFAELPLDGANPVAGLIQGADGSFYGTTYQGGANDQGTVFRMDVSGLTITLHSFAETDGANPQARLMQTADGGFYGTTLRGGAAHYGTVFTMNSSGLVTTLHSFVGSAGETPIAGLMQGSDGNFYGTTSTNAGGTGYGTVFKIDSFGVLTTLHTFGEFRLEGAFPEAGLVQGSDGNFYGTTYGGGAANRGAVFKVEPSGVATTVYSFTGQAVDGGSPSSGLIQGSDGNFYGTTDSGGTSNKGTVFRMDSLGNLTTLHSFAGTNGASPFAGGLIEATDGSFYGTTRYGGTADKGTVFKLSPLGVFMSVHSFSGSGAANPFAGVIQANDGNFYGTTYFGGSGQGTIFKMEPSGAVTTLHSFSGSDGSNVRGGLIQGSDGNFYGTTSFGGVTNHGTVFKMNSSGAVTTLHFFNGDNGAFPFSGLTQGSDGHLYGTTFSGGRLQLGVVFRIDLRPWPVSVVSRKTHGTSGDFSIALPLAGEPGIECRTGGTNNEYQIVVTFANAVTFNSAAITSGPGTVAGSSGSGTPAVMVNLAGITNAQTITVTLSGVNDGAYTGDVSFQMSVLLGDTTGDGAVNSSDISQTKLQSGQAVTASNFRQDVTVNGSINSSDISLVKSKSGTGL